MERRSAWWLWALLALGFAAMLPGLLGRVQIEQANGTYELSVPAEELSTLIDAGIEADVVYGRLADAGLTSVAMEMQTIGDLEEDGRLSVLTRAQLRNQLIFADVPPSALPDGDGTFVALAGDEPQIVAALDAAGTVEEVEVAGRQLLMIDDVADPRQVVIGFDDDAIRELVDRGFDVIARVPERTGGLNAEVIGDELERVSEEFGVRLLLFSGMEAPYLDEPEALRTLAGRIRDIGYDLLFIEFVAQDGLEDYYRIVERGIRLHSIDLATIRPDAAVDRAVRAVKERNIRVIFLRPAERSSPEQQLDDLASVASGTTSSMPPGFEPGQARPFGDLQSSPLLLAGAMMAAVALGALSGLILGRWFAVLGGAFMAVVGAIWLLTGSSLVGDVLRLAVAVAAATAAVLLARPRARLALASLEYLKATAVVVIGGLVVVGLAFENRFLISVGDFWGVKALLIAPLLVAAAWAAHRSMGRPGFREIPRLARMPIELWQVIAVAATGAALWYLVLRSGNTGAAADWEIGVRQGLEDLLYVRPRTKEFLIGFPALIAGITLTARWRHGWWLYAVASIGTASAIDSFTHFHTPIVISLLRTLYAAGFGYVIGLALLGILVLALRGFDRYLRPRWR